MFDATSIENTKSAYEFVVADLTGDRRDDLLLSPAQGSKASIRFDGARVSTVEDTQLGAEELVASGELNCDTSQDVVAISISGSPNVWYSNAEGGLSPVSQLVVPPSGSVRRVVSVDADADGRPEPLLLVDRQLYRIPNDGSSAFQPLLTTDVSAEKLVAAVASGNWNSESPCGELALAARDTSRIHIYSLCDGAGKISSVELPGDERIGGRGLFSADVDGDGRDDLVATGADPDVESAAGAPLYVSYGVGNGTFHDTSNPPAAVRGNGRAAWLPVSPSSALLTVADLDGDQRADFVLEDRTVFSRRDAPDCRDCAEPRTEYWASAAAADFNRDGIVDLIGTPVDTRRLSFSMGLGSGAFNEFSVPTEGNAASSVFAADHETFIGTGPNGTGPLIAVGDFDGDLTQDFAFVERFGREPNRYTLSVLFGVPLGVPSDPKHIASLAGISDLAAGALFSGPNTLSDLVILGQNSNTEGVGLYAGKTDRLLFSPLALPNDASTNQPVELAAVALGQFRAEDRVRCAESSEPARRKDMALLVRAQSGPLLYFFEASAAHGFEASAGEEPLRLPDAAGVSELALIALDVDGAAGDGVDELIIYPLCIVPGPFRYWLARRGQAGFSAREYTLEVSDFSQLSAANDPLPRMTRVAVRDVSNDGSPDLVLWADRFTSCAGGDFADVSPALDGAGGEGASYVLVFPNRGHGQLESGTALDVASAEDATFLNADQDPALELAVATEHGVRVFDLSIEQSTLTPVTTLGGSDEKWWRVAAGDFDGDGVEDVAAIPYAEDRDTRVFWGRARTP